MGSAGPEKQVGRTGGGAFGVRDFRGAVVSGDDEVQGGGLRNG